MKSRIARNCLLVSLPALACLGILSGPTVSLSLPAAGDSLNVSGSFTDSRDGEIYGWVRIGDQIWMAENLRFRTDTGSWCWENDEAECDKRGRFYNWETAQKVAPYGWHIPSEREWQELELFLGLTPEQIEQTGIERGGAFNTFAARLKIQGGWPNEYEGTPLEITNDTGFSAVETGFYGLGEFSHSGYTAWWSSTEDGDQAWIRLIGFWDNKIGRTLNNKAHAFTIRCVKDATH